MAIVVPKKKAVGYAAETPEIQGTSNEVTALIDEIGAMLPAVEATQKQIKALQASLATYAVKMKTLVALVTVLEGKAPDEVFTQEGTAYSATVGKQAMVRTVRDVELAIKLLNKAKKGVAYEVVSVPLGKIDSYLTPEEKAQVLHIGHGDRSVAIAPKKIAMAAE